MRINDIGLRDAHRLGPFPGLKSGAEYLRAVLFGGRQLLKIALKTTVDTRRNAGIFSYKVAGKPSTPAPCPVQGYQLPCLFPPRSLGLSPDSIAPWKAARVGNQPHPAPPYAPRSQHHERPYQHQVRQRSTPRSTHLSSLHSPPADHLHIMAKGPPPLHLSTYRPSPLPGIFKSHGYSTDQPSE